VTSVGPAANGCTGSVWPEKLQSRGFAVLRAIRQDLVLTLVYEVARATFLQVILHLSE
jgi:hypothetical protein